MRYFNKNMTANEVRARLFNLLYKETLGEKEKQIVMDEHEQMCQITVNREMELAAAGWMTESR